MMNLFDESQKDELKLFSGTYFPINSKKTPLGIGLRIRYAQPRDFPGQAHKFTYMVSFAARIVKATTHFSLHAIPP